MDTLERTHHGTVRAQRIGNQLGWGSVALALTVGFHLLVDTVVNRRLDGCCDLWSLTFTATGFDATATAGLWGLRLGLSVALGTLIGIIAAEYVRSRPVTVATTVAAAYTGLAALALFATTGPLGSELLPTLVYVLLIATTLPVAHIWARRRIR